MKVLDAIISVALKNGFVYTADKLKLDVPIAVTSAKPEERVTLKATVEMENVVIRIDKKEEQ